MRGAALALVIAGCGGHAPPAQPAGNEGETPATTLAACPSSDELIADLRRLQSTDPAQQQLSIDACVAGAFGRPGWAIAARAESDDMEATRYVFVIDTSHEMIGALPQEGIDFRTDGSPVILEVADLDGDGVDELIERVSHHDAGLDEQYLDVLTVSDGSLTRTIDVQLIFEDDTGRCEASYEVAPGGLKVTAQVTRGDGSGCLPPGETFVPYAPS